jgi:lysophospholipase L1-like esterase
MGLRLLPFVAAFLSLALLMTQQSTARAQDAPVYLALGDSFAFGVGASEPSTTGYVARAHQALLSSERYRQSGLELINLSVPGAKSTDLLTAGGQLDSALNIIGERGLDASESNGVEVITIDIGGNDLLALVAPDSPCLKSASVEPCRAAFGDVLSAIQTNLTETLHRLRDAAPQAIIVVVDLYNPYSGTGDLREPIAELGVGQANGVIGAVTADAALRVQTASVFQLFSGRGLQWIAPDGIHPNDSGHAVIAEAVIAAISGREPVIPDELGAASPGITAAPANVNMPTESSDGSSDISPAVFGAAIIIAFVAGLVVCAGYFLARGRL